MYIHKLDDTVNKCNNRYYKAIKMRLVDINPRMYIGFNLENKMEGLKFKVANHVIISKYKNIYTKCYVPNWS